MLVLVAVSVREIFNLHSAPTLMDIFEDRLTFLNFFTLLYNVGVSHILQSLTCTASGLRE